MNSSVISIESLEVCHGPKTILSIPDLAVEEGKILALIGPNGAGKSTLLQVLGLLHSPARGRVVFKGQEVTRASNLVALRRRMALVFQEPLLFRGTVFDNVRLGLGLRGVPRNEARERTELWLAKLNLSHLAHQSVARLSVGEAQRVNLARSLVLDPEVFLLDEPFASLDPPTQASLVEELQRILAETKTTTVFVTHNRTEALMLGHRLAVMLDGRIVQTDTPERVFSRPASEEIATFLGLETLTHARVLSVCNGFSKVAMADHEISVAGAYSPREQVSVCLRPEDITVLPEDAMAHRTPDANVMKGTISRITPLETQFKVVVDCSILITVLVSKQAFIDLALTKGKPVLLVFKPSAAHVIPGTGVRSPVSGFRNQP